MQGVSGEELPENRQNIDRLRRQIMVTSFDLVVDDCSPCSVPTRLFSQHISCSHEHGWLTATAIELCPMMEPVRDGDLALPRYHPGYAHAGGQQMIVDFPPYKYAGGHILVVTGGNSTTVFLADSSYYNRHTLPYAQFMNWWNGYGAAVTPM